MRENLRNGEIEMSMTEWAKREVEIAYKRENPDRKEGEWDYGCACYKSALKAYESLCEDGHSGCSFGITKNILMRLCDGLPLTPIEDTDDIWDDVSCMGNDEYDTYQCKRMSSLFKKVYNDGTVKYNDVERCKGVDIDSGWCYGGGLVDRIIDEMYPIEMPYMPAAGKYKVYTTDLLTDSKNGDFDTVTILYVKTPSGDKIDINRYFKESENGWKEIDREEYIERLAMHETRLEKLKRQQEENKNERSN